MLIFSLDYKNFVQHLSEILHQNLTEGFYQKVLDLSLEYRPSAQAGSVMRLNEDGRYYFVAANGFDLRALQSITLTLDESILHAPKDKHSFLFHNFNDFNQEYLDEERYKTFLNIGRVKEIQETLCIPVRKSGEIIATFCLDSFESGTAFSTDEIMIAEHLGALLSLSIENKPKPLEQPLVTLDVKLPPEKKTY